MKQKQKGSAHLLLIALVTVSIAALLGYVVFQKLRSNEEYTALAREYQKMSEVHYGKVPANISVVPKDSTGWATTTLFSKATVLLPSDWYASGIKSDEVTYRMGIQTFVTFRIVDPANSSRIKESNQSIAVGDQIFKVFTVPSEHGYDYVVSGYRAGTLL